MYRDGYEAALEALKENRKRVAERASGLDQARDDLPAGVSRTLRDLEEQLSPKEKTVAAIQASHEALDAYERKVNDALNIVAQIRGARARGERLQFSDDGIPLYTGQFRRWAARIALVGAFLFAFGYLPDWLLQAASERQNQCFADVTDMGGDAEPCRERAKLLWPLTVPWTHERALDRWIDGEERAERLDARSRYNNAADSSFEALVDRGAFEALSKRSEGLTSLKAAAVVGDVDAIRRHALALEPADAKTHRIRGAWLCLLGDREEGLQSLVASDELSRGHGAPKTPIALGMVACGGTESSMGRYPYDVVASGTSAMTYLRLSDPTWQPDRRLSVLKELRLEHATNPTMLVAYAVTSDETMEWEEALRWVAPRIQSRGVSPPRSALTPWAVRSRHPLREFRFIDPAAFERAFQQLSRLTDTAPESPPPGRIINVDDDAWNDPKAALAQAAWWIGWHAAIGYVRRGDNASALEVLERAQALAPPDEVWWSAAVHIAAGDHEGAIRLLAEAPSAVSRDAFSLLHLEVNRVYALAAAGRRSLALVAASNLGERPSKVIGALPAEARALSAAIQLVVVGKPLGATPKTVSFEDMHIRRHAVTAQWVDKWLGIATSDDETRALARFRITDLRLYHRRSALPAAFILVGTAADGGRFEDWLNHVFGRWHLQGEGIATIDLARAEAARWRGDDASAKRWKSRADRLHNLVVGPKTAILMHIAGDSE